MRSHLITADAISAYIFRCDPRISLSNHAKYAAIGGLHLAETLLGRRRSAMDMHIDPLYERCLM